MLSKQRIGYYLEGKSALVKQDSHLGTGWRSVYVCRWLFYTWLTNSGCQIRGHAKCHDAVTTGFSSKILIGLAQKSFCLASSADTIRCWKMY